MEAIHFSSNTDLDSVRRAHPGISLSQLYALDREQRLGRERKELNASTTPPGSIGWLVTLASVALDASDVVIEIPLARPLNKAHGLQLSSKKEAPADFPRGVYLCTAQLAMLDGSRGRQIGVLTKAEKKVETRDKTAALRLLGTVWRETEIRRRPSDPLLAAARIVFPSDAVVQVTENLLEITSYEIESVNLLAWWLAPRLVKQESTLYVFRGADVMKDFPSLRHYLK